MGKFPFKRPRIISKKFPHVDSTIDGVTKSLNDLVFSYSEKVDKALQKKHLMMAISSLVLLVVLGSFISPKGKAESSIFYPETCLGGWVNPSHAQGDLQTTSNDDIEQFSEENSAILPKNTNAEMYCGNFKGKFDETTKPTKIIVSLALTKGADVVSHATATSTATSTVQAVDASSSSFLLDASSTATSTPTSDTTSDATSTAPTETTITASTTSSVSTTTATTVESSSSTLPEVPVQEESNSLLDGVIKSILDVFQSNDTPAPQGDVPVAPVSDQPTSYQSTLKENFASFFFSRAFAEDTIPTDSATTTQLPPLASSTLLEASSTDMVSTTSTSTLLTSSSTDVGTSTDFVASSTDDNQFQNNFLEVLYSFDGVTWTSLGTLNEISMKYRTFEIPVTASTSWSDMSQLQVKIEAVRHDQDTPAVYLDGIKVEVLYETSLTHVHPDFARDIILKDEIVDGIRVLTIINNDTKEQEVWYMYLDATSTVPALAQATGTSAVGSTTSFVLATTTGSSTQALGTGTDALTYDATGTAVTPVVDLLKRTWKKYEGKETELATPALVEEIKKQEKEEEEVKEKEKEAEIPIVPDFAIDTIKRMKGVFAHTVLVQIKRAEIVATSTATTTEGGIIEVSSIDGTPTHDELWLYDTEKNTEEKIGVHASTTVKVTLAEDSPIGVKGGYLFWLSSDKTTIYAYKLDTKMILTMDMPAFNPAHGERAEITFEQIPWKVIVSSEGFSFYSPHTGEVFSDEDSHIVQDLYVKMKLDYLLNKEELSNLSLPVEAEQ